MKKHPRLDLDTANLRVRPHAEFHSTNDKSLFHLDSVPEGFWPLYKGESFDLWNPDTGKYYGGVNPEIVVKHLLNKRKNQARMSSSAFSLFPASWLSDPKTLPIESPRIAIRKITNRTNSRSLICALIPPRVAVTEGAPYLMFPTGDTRDMAYLLGVLSSIPLDWQARRIVEVNMTYHILNSLSFPRPGKGDREFSRVVEIAGRMAAPDKRFTAWASAVGVEVGSVKSAVERDDLVAELDAIVGILYGLNRDQLIHIFSTFQRGWDYRPRLDATLVHFESWSEKNVQ